VAHLYLRSGTDQKDLAGNAVKKHLGSEFDFVTSYALNKTAVIEFGLAYMAATGSMEYAKAVTPGSSQLNNVWSYLSLNIKPEFLFK
jgi:hypothetical protein